ncbi:histone family protein [Candidatus Woesearchaeota archaeon]|jgi:DNA-binding protein|nr:histone family protein [Candidatus Woesearchaeota archaeon]MBT5272904.1 histone family protein [Candidatus Woesearchaeota archaeon]MBT6041370.1 histone family protein [Candidatus Woesearchaeota archaeon]MBT6337253.1 histone family protein [Candidatus Woesearchaeota archaeon]MBT7927130.1 histone family protein [Candidatus Woesearchaeota archaeon]
MVTRRTAIIPKAPLGRILNKMGAKRVSDSALDLFSEVLAEIGTDIAEQAAKIAKHAGRKTIHEEDIKLASKQV